MNIPRVNRDTSQSQLLVKGKYQRFPPILIDAVVIMRKIFNKDRGTGTPQRNGLRTAQLEERIVGTSSTLQ